MGVAIDLTDALASALQARTGAMSARAKLLVGAGAVSFAAAGALALAAEPPTVAVA